MLDASAPVAVVESAFLSAPIVSHSRNSPFLQRVLIPLRAKKSELAASGLKYDVRGKAMNHQQY